MVSVHTIKTYKGNNIRTYILAFITSTLAGQLHEPTVLRAWKEPWQKFMRKIRGSQGRSRYFENEKFLLLSDIESRNIQPVA
jgi:hypothetical protein